MTDWVSMKIISTFKNIFDPVAFLDVANSSKLIGRISWSGYFEPWVTATFFSNCGNFDEHPCCFQYICERPFSDIGIDRLALHLSHNCPKELVDAIYFRSNLPEDGNASEYVEHFDENGFCQVSGSDYECNSFITRPKTEAGREGGSDDAWLLPDDYNGLDDVPFTYSYNVYVNGG